MNSAKTSVAQTAQPQSITPELRKWIVDQAQAGHSPESVLKAMLASGWQEDIAIEAMESTLKDHLNQQAVAQGLGPASKVPDPSIDESPLTVDAGDRQVEILFSMFNPRVVVFGNLLSDEECAGLIAQAKPKLARSMTVDNQTGGEELNESRTSNGMFFQRGETDLVDRVEKRIAKLLNWPLLNGEGLQILHYRPGAEYKPHYDYFDPAQPGSATILKRGGQRVATLVMYLNSPTKGGGTTFPDVHLEVAPKKGGAVFFSYERPDPSTKTLHGGAPVIEGEKWVATKWLREGEFH
jgi:prolyl 4-hydroxylase